MESIERITDAIDMWFPNYFGEDFLFQVPHHHRNIFPTFISDAILEWTRTVVLKLFHDKDYKRRFFYGSGSDFH